MIAQLLRPRTFAAASTLLLLVWVVYEPVSGYLYVFDDHQYLLRNSAVHHGLSWRSVAWAFTTFAEANWHPLTWISHLLDISVFGMRPAAPHVENVAWHGANSVALFLVLAAATGSFGKSLTVAALFALHPLHVESVAWVAERKDLLSTFFGLLAIAGYIAYSRKRSVTRYLAVVAGFGLSLLCKPMLVTLPFLFLLLDYYPLGSGGNTDRGPRAGWPARLLEKVPLFALSAASSAVTYVAQTRGGGMSSTETYALPYRLQNAVLSFVNYLKMTLWPKGLACYYPHPLGSIPPGKLWLAGAVLVIATCLAVVLRRRAPFLPVSWFWFLGTLVPVIGFVQVGGQAMADRYTYFPIVGLFIAIVWGAAALARRLPATVPPNLSGLLGAFTVVAACGVLARVQLTYWRDEVTLFERAISVTTGNVMAHSNVAAAYNDLGQRDLAIRHYREALDIVPGDPQLHFNLGIVLTQAGRLPEADRHFRLYTEYSQRSR